MKCSQHGLSEDDTVQNFYTRLTQSMRIALDSAAEGGLLHHDYDTVVEIIKMMASNSYAYSFTSNIRVKGK